MTHNEMIKKLKEVFGNGIQYKVVAKDGRVFKSKGFVEEKERLDRTFKKF